MKSARTLTGWHAAAIFGSFFGVIITVNLALAYSASFVTYRIATALGGNA